VVKARIVDLPKPGVVVALPHDIEGFVPLSQLARGGKKAKEKYQIGEELELKVIRVDSEHRRIALSERALLPLSEQVPEEAPEVERPRSDGRPPRERRERRRDRDDSYEGEQGSSKFTLEDHLRELESEE